VKLHKLLGYRALRLAAGLGLVSLGLMMWGVVDPRPISLVIAMSVGQAFGTAAFAVYGLVVFVDLRRARVLAKAGASRPSDSPAQTK